jgi:hypothetical protein
MAWEYKIVQGPKERNLNRIITEEELGKFDAQGWELLTAFTLRGRQGSTGTQENEGVYYIFRRVKK